METRIVKIYLGFDLTEVHIVCCKSAACKSSFFLLQREGVFLYCSSSLMIISF